MRLKGYWCIIHNWNMHRRHRHCMVAVMRHMDLSPEGCCLEFVHAATHGRLWKHEDAIRHLRKQPDTERISR